MQAFGHGIFNRNGEKKIVELVAGASSGEYEEEHAQKKPIEECSREKQALVLLMPVAVSVPKA
ncbi:MAG: hypothetical protein INR71_12320 [Terriglobus roseus]|nr:hypothetical protein [Terriglobus roseus]